MERLILRWWKRLVTDDGWTISFHPDENLHAPATVTADHCIREVHFAYRPQDKARSKVACHEVCHVLVERTYYAGCKLANALQASEPAHCLFAAAAEEDVDALARAFLRAYEEEV